MVLVIKALHDAGVHNKDQETARNTQYINLQFTDILLCHFLTLISCKLN